MVGRVVAAWHVDRPGGGHGRGLAESSDLPRTGAPGGWGHVCLVARLGLRSTDSGAGVTLDRARITHRGHTAWTSRLLHLSWFPLWPLPGDRTGCGRYETGRRGRAPQRQVDGPSFRLRGRAAPAPLPHLLPPLFPP